MCMTCDDTRIVSELLPSDGEYAPRYDLCVQADDGGLGSLVIPDAGHYDAMARFRFLTEEKSEGWTQMRSAELGDDPSKVRCWLVVKAPAEWAYFLGRYAKTLNLGESDLTELGVLDAAVKALEKEALGLFSRLPELNREALDFRDGTGAWAESQEDWAETVDVW